MNPRNKRVRHTPGSVIAIPLPDGRFGYGRILRDPMIAFYDLRSDETLSVEAVLTAPIAFTIFVAKSPVTRGEWPVIGTTSLTAELLDEPRFFKKDSISGALTIYRDGSGEERPATKEQCAGLECAAVWSANHVIDRLVDHFAGRPNRWVESMRP